MDPMVDAAPKGAIEFFHGYTYSAIPCSVAGLAMQDIFEKEDYLSVQKKCHHILRRFIQLKRY